MNPSTSIPDTVSGAAQGAHQEDTARRLGERPDERRSGERRDVQDDAHDPDFARGEDRRNLP